MVPGKYYFAKELAEQHDFALGTIHVKLYQLADEGFVEWRKSHITFKMEDGKVIHRVQYRRTGKNIPIHTGRLQPQM